MADASKITHPILIVDDKTGFIEADFANSALIDSRSIYADSVGSALEVLTDKHKLLSGIFVSPAIGAPTWLHVLKAAHQHRPGLPIFLIETRGMPAFSDDELAHMGIQQIVPHPVTYEELRLLLLESDVGFHPYALRELARRSEDSVKLEDESGDSGFVPLRIEHLLASKKSFFDLYLKLSPRKYVKVLKFGDALPEERILGYIEQGVTHLFLKREAQEHYLAYCSAIALRVLESGKAAPQRMQSMTLNYGEQTIRFLEEHGVNSTSLKYARKYVDKVQTLVTKMAQSNGYVQELMKNVALYDHAVSTAIVAGLMVEKIGIKSKDVFASSGLAVLLHDIGLLDSTEAVRAEDPSKMTQSELMDYYVHPERGAKILAGFKEFPKAVIEAVQQHHMRPRARPGELKGFPQKGVSKDASINRLAELIGVSDEFTQLIAAAQKDRALDPLHVMEHERLSGFSDAVASVFRSTFLLDK